MNEKYIHSLMSNWRVKILNIKLPLHIQNIALSGLIIYRNYIIYFIIPVGKIVLKTHQNIIYNRILDVFKVKLYFIDELYILYLQIKNISSQSIQLYHSKKITFSKSRFKKLDKRFLSLLCDSFKIQLFIIKY